jgi:2,4-dienoyl-CoA reductase (NADPH2)
VLYIIVKDDKIGGLLNLIWRPPGRSEFHRMIDDYNYWIQKHGINIHLEQEVNLNTVKDFNPDVVFVATGSKPIKPPIPGMDRENVYWANDLFRGDAPVGNNNVVIGGGATGIECALYLAEFGTLSMEAVDFLTFYNALTPEVALKMRHTGRNKVNVLEKLPKLGSNLGKTTKWVLLDKCDAYGVKFLTSVNVTEIGDNYVNYTDASGKENAINDVDYVFYATGVESDDAIYQELKQLEGIELEKMGDARKPETVLEAVNIGYKKANRI